MANAQPTPPAEKENAPKEKTVRLIFKKGTAMNVFHEKNTPWLDGDVREVPESKAEKLLEWHPEHFSKTSAKCTEPRTYEETQLAILRINHKGSAPKDTDL